MADTAGADESGDFQVFLVAAEPAREHMAPNFTQVIKGDVAVIGSRARTGFGGMITVTAVLLVVQLISGVQAFPL